MAKKTRGRKLVRKEIVETLPWRIVGEFDHFDNTNGSTEGIIRRLQEIQQKAEAAGYTNISLSTSGGYEDSVETYVQGARLETNKEYNKRTEANKKERERRGRKREADKKKKEIADREQYLKLKKRFKNE